MRNIILATVASLFFFVGCSSDSEYSEDDVTTALVAFEAYPEKDELCRTIFGIDRTEVKSVMKEAYEGGVPHGEAWTNVGIEPTLPQVYALVDLTYDYCESIRN
jgi:hypothetical protein